MVNINVLFISKELKKSWWMIFSQVCCQRNILYIIISQKRYRKGDVTCHILCTWFRNKCNWSEVEILKGRMLESYFPLSQIIFSNVQLRWCLKNTYRTCFHSLLTSSLKRNGYYYAFYGLNYCDCLIMLHKTVKVNWGN